MSIVNVKFHSFDNRDEFGAPMCRLRILGGERLPKGRTLHKVIAPKWFDDAAVRTALRTALGSIESAVKNIVGEWMVITGCPPFPDQRRLNHHSLPL